MGAKMNGIRGKKDKTQYSSAAAAAAEGQYKCSSKTK
jgi:hypothetical protein